MQSPMAAIFRSANVLYDYAAADYLFRLNLSGQREEGETGTAGWAEESEERERGNLGKDVCEELTSNFRKSSRNPPRGNRGAGAVSR